VALAVGLPAGVVAATRRNSAIDVLSRTVSLVGMAVPNFFLGFILILIFSLWLGVLPPSGYALLNQDPIQNFRYMLMPACALGLALAAAVARMMRSSLLEALLADFAVTARAKGLGSRTVVIRHALRNAALPVVTVVGLQMGVLLGGAVLVETVFALPGVGRLVVDSIFARDFPVVQGAVIVLGLFRILCTLGVDIAYSWLDPRISLR
jgi:peptide/nickel transport system permease protein